MVIMSQMFTSLEMQDKTLLSLGELSSNTQESKKIFDAFLEKGEDGWIIVKCPELNIVTQGKTEHDAVVNLSDAATMMNEEFNGNKDFSLSITSKIRD